MRIVLQRVKKASVVVEGEKIAVIDKGFLLLVGVEKNDNPETAEKLAKKVSKLRIFEDENGKMNLDIKTVKGGILSVPQFTLLADTEKGLRPGFERAARPQDAKSLWEKFNEFLKDEGIAVAVGEFGAGMEVSLVNDGPVTFVLEG